MAAELCSFLRHVTVYSLGPKRRLANGLRASVALWAQSSDAKVARLVADLGEIASVETCRVEAARRKVSLPVGLTDARAYDLRHTFASIGSGGGLSLQIIGRLLGHTQSRTTQRYAHLADDPLREAATKIGGVIAGAGKGAAGAVVTPISAIAFPARRA